jgi:hypothetical protein
LGEEVIQLVRPCRGHVTQWYGNKQSQDGRKHTGQDYAYYSSGQVMDEVFAAADGVVLYAGDSRDLGWPNGWYLNPDFDRNDAVDSSAGNVIALGHNRGGIRFDTTYNHLESWTVKAGDTVRAGQRIGTIGATGYSVGKHLHFELLFRPFNFGTDTYGRANPNPYFVTGIAAAGSTPTPSTPSEEDDMSKAAEEDISRIRQILEAQETDRIRERIVAIDDRTAILIKDIQYVKGADDPTFYERMENGTYRPISYTEWKDTGKPYAVYPQADADAWPKAG